MSQDHLLECLKIGEKTQKKFLAKQVASINFKLLQHAFQSVSMPLNRFSLSTFIHTNSAIFHQNAFNISSECLSFAAQAKDDINYELHNEGCQLLMHSKAAIIVILHNEVDVENSFDIDDTSGSMPDAKLRYFQELVHVYNGHLKIEEGMSFPLILVSPSHEIKSYEEILLDREYYGMDSQKVWFLEEEKLPVISKSVDPKILLKSSCEIIQKAIGSGGVFSSISSHHITDKLIEMGVEYVQICCLGRRYKPVVVGNPLFLGLIKCREADMAIHMNMTEGKIEEEDAGFNIIFSMSHLTKICKLVDQPQLLAIPEQHAHVEMVKVEGKHVEQIHPIPNEPNSYSFHSSIYSVLATCSPDSICAMCVT